jgi:hypothetical protein
MTWAPMRASPETTGKVPQQQKRSLPGGRAANIDLDNVEVREQKASVLRRLKPPVPVAVVRAPFVILLIVSVIAGVVGILVLNTKITENAFTLSRMRNEQTLLDQKEQHLNQLISNHESPGSLAAAAAKLGLVEAGPPAFIVLPDGRTIGVPKPATGTPSVTSQ